MTSGKIICRFKDGSLEDRNGITVLKIKGNPYEMGYQHGYLLSRNINYIVKQGLEGAAAVISKSIDCSFDEALSRMKSGLDYAKDFFPGEISEEMSGIYDGLKDTGVDSLTLDDILMWNTMYDQWCIYAHPYHWNPVNYKKTGSEIHNSFLSGAGCSSFSAWGSASKNGDMIFGKNMDNLDLPGILDNRVCVIAKPSDGYGHSFITHPGMVGIDGGLNNQNLAMMTQYNASIHETMAGCGIGIFTRLILKHAENTAEAVNILKRYPRCTGIAYHFADGKAKTSVVAEASSEQVTVRYPKNEEEYIWTSNHSNCYPGWEGYDGYNMVKDQEKVYALDDTSTISTWQDSLKILSNTVVPAPSRFERYRELINSSHGEITHETAINILSDRYDPYTRSCREKYESSSANNNGASICALYGDDTFSINETSFTSHISNLWSLAANLSGNEFWLAIKGFPAQYEGYEYFNLEKELNEM